MGIGKKMGSAQALAKASKKGANSNMWSIPEAGIIVRFLDEPEDWFGYTRYYDEENQGYVPMIDGERAPSGARTQFRFVANAVKVEDDKVIAFDMPKSMGAAMNKYYDKYGTLLDRDYDFSKSGSGLQTEYAVAPDSKEPKKLSKYEKLNLEDVLMTQRDATLSDGSGGTDTADDDAPAKVGKASKAAPKAAAKAKAKAPNFDELGEKADEDDEDAQASLTELAEALEIDPDDYDSWAELATALAEPPAAPEEEVEAEPETADADDEDLEALGEQADDDDDDAQTKLTALAAEADLDPDAYDTWAELATALHGAGDGEAAGEEDGDVLDEDDLRAMSLTELKKIAKQYDVTVPAKTTVDKLVDLIIAAAEEE